MADNNTEKKRRIRHRGREQQLPIYFVKHLRMFVYQKDWIVLPLSALIAGMVSMVIRNGFGIYMEFTLTGSFALTCVAIWNGCFNSVQVVCRERAIIKREHRSGMHVTSYIASHMIYQAILCIMQAALTVYICMLCGVRVDGEGIITQWRMLDIGISLFIISYVSDMLSLLISCLVHTTTAAMTVMPFVLIFQLVFSGAIFQLPAWATRISDWTISNYGMRAIASQAHYNELPMQTGWKMLDNMRDTVVLEPMTVEQILDYTGEEAELVRALFPEEKLQEKVTEQITVGKIIDIAGEDTLRELITTKTAAVNQQEKYAATKENIMENWMTLICLGILFTLLGVIALEFIDKDKR